MTSPAEIDSVTDPDGRLVVLDADGWQHILDNHPEMAAYQRAIMSAIGQPDYRRRDPGPGRERYFRQGVGPSRWCMVVVDLTRTPARVVTAFGTRRDPEGWR